MDPVWISRLPRAAGLRRARSGARGGAAERPARVLRECGGGRPFRSGGRPLAGTRATVVEIDFTPFLAAARLLYEGPWVAERYAAIRDFLEVKPEALHPVTRRIIAGAKPLTAAGVFEAMHRLAALRRQAEAAWAGIDVLLTPTAGPTVPVAVCGAHLSGLPLNG